MIVFENLLRKYIYIQTASELKSHLLIQLLHYLIIWNILYTMWHLLKVKF